MTETKNKPHPRAEYRYESAEENPSHAYLDKPVLNLLSSLPTPTRVLDAGCGNGSLTRRLHAEGFDVAGFDASESGIRHAREATPDIRFETASVYDDWRLLFDTTFDVVLAVELIEHLDRPRDFLRRAREALTPSGHLILSTPYHGYWKNLCVALSGRFDAHVNPLWDGGHIKFWSRRTLSRLLDEEGFRVLRFVGAGRVPYLWKSMILLAASDAGKTGGDTA